MKDTDGELHPNLATHPTTSNTLMDIDRASQHPIVNYLGHTDNFRNRYL